MGKVAVAAGGIGGVALSGLLALGAVSASPPAALAAATVPAGYAPLIQADGSNCPAISPPLLAAQIYAESGFDPTAVSSVGAQGIAQFMPATWAIWGTDADGDGRADPFDPADAIATAARYDCSLARDVHTAPGDPVANMLAAYNAGPYAVITAGGVPPIPQTQTYVKRILGLEPAFAPTTAATTSPTAGSTSSTGTAAAQVRAAVTFSYDLLGTPYEWGGTGADGRFDCSGLTQAAYASAGITLPRTAAEQWYTGPHIPRPQLQPGDLVFFATNLTQPATIHHVGLYTGGGYMIDAPHTGASIRFDAINQADYIGAVRPAH